MVGCPVVFSSVEMVIALREVASPSPCPMGEAAVLSAAIFNRVSIVDFRHRRPVWTGSAVRIAYKMLNTYTCTCTCSITITHKINKVVIHPVKLSLNAKGEKAKTFGEKANLPSLVLKARYHSGSDLLKFNFRMACLSRHWTGFPQALGLL